MPSRRTKRRPPTADAATTPAPNSGGGQGLFNFLGGVWKAATGAGAAVASAVGAYKFWAGDTGLITTVLLVLALTALWFSALYYLWQQYGRAALVGHPGRRELLRKWGVGGALAFVLLPFVGVGGYHLYQWWENLPNGKKLVLVADFEKLGKEDRAVTENILSQLRTATSRFSEDADIEPLNRTITARGGSKLARQLGEERNASIVIWGWYDNSNAHAYFETMDSFDWLPLRQSSERLGLNQTGPGGAEVQIRLSEDMSHLALLTLGILRFDGGDYAGAVERLNKALEVNAPEQMVDPATAYVYRGYAYGELKRLDEAAADYTRVIDAAAASAKAAGASAVLDEHSRRFAALSHNNRGLIFLKGKQYDRAAQDFEQALKYEPEFPEAHLGSGEVAYALAGVEKDEAVKPQLLRAAVAKFSKAIDNSEKVPNGPVRFRALSFAIRGSVLGALGRYDPAFFAQAFADHTESLRLDPLLPDAYFYRAGTFLSARKIEEAAADYTRTLELKHDFDDAYAYRAWANLMLGSGEAAAGDARTYIDRSKWGGEYVPYMVIVEYIGRRQAGKDVEEARRTLSEALTRLEASAWPAPIIRYLRGDLPLNELLSQANDKIKMTEARGVVSADFMIAGRAELAVDHLKWLREGGAKDYFEYMLAESEARRRGVSY